MWAGLFLSFARLKQRKIKSQGAGQALALPRCPVFAQVDLKGWVLPKLDYTHTHTHTSIRESCWFYTHTGARLFFLSKACAACSRERSWLSAHGQQLRRGSACVFGQLRLSSVSEWKLTEFSSKSESSSPFFDRVHGLGILFLHACSIARVRKRREECTNSLRAKTLSNIFYALPKLDFLHINAPNAAWMYFFLKKTKLEIIRTKRWVSLEIFRWKKVLRKTLQKRKSRIFVSGNESAKVFSAQWSRLLHCVLCCPCMCECMSVLHVLQNMKRYFCCSNNIFTWRQLMQ